jgi:hypothetical protein
MLQIFTFVCLAFIMFAIIKIVKSFLFKKKVELAKPDQFIHEINEAKNEENQILVVFNDGYWEIKEETVTKEWSAETGSQTFVDFDLNIDDKRYKSFMDKALDRNEEGEHSLSVIKELELESSLDAETVLHLKY